MEDPRDISGQLEPKEEYSHSSFARQLNFIWEWNSGFRFYSQHFAFHAGDILVWVRLLPLKMDLIYLKDYIQSSPKYTTRF